MNLYFSPRKFHANNKFSRATTMSSPAGHGHACARMWYDLRSQHFRPFIYLQLLYHKLWLFFGTSKLRTSLTVSYPRSSWSSLSSRYVTDCYTRLYYCDRKRISVILSFPDTGQLLAYNSNLHLLINMVATHHRLESVGLV